MVAKNKTKIVLGFAMLALGLWVWLGASAYMLSLMTQVCATAVILCSLRILVGMGGMIHFGYALYPGMGAYGAAHLLLLAQHWGVSVPLWLVPLGGGVAGFVTAFFAGWLNTRRVNSIYCAMVSLALCELVYTLAQILPAFFGTDGGLQIDRTNGNFLWFDFADARLLLLLTAIYLAGSLWCMQKFTQTPLGFWLCAVREDAVRVACLGMVPRHIQYVTFLIAGFFAGIGGALLMLELESANVSMFSMTQSGSYLMFTYLGGLGHLWGSVMGAFMQVGMLIGLPVLTPASELYLGLVFVYAVLRMPQGIYGMLLELRNLYKVKRQLWWILQHFFSVLSSICLIEFIYRLWDTWQGTVLSPGMLLRQYQNWGIWFIIFMLLAFAMASIERRRCQYAS